MADEQRETEQGGMKQENQENQQAKSDDIIAVSHATADRPMGGPTTFQQLQPLLLSLQRHYGKREQDLQKQNQKHGLGQQSSDNITSVTLLHVAPTTPKSQAPPPSVIDNYIRRICLPHSLITAILTNQKLTLHLTAQCGRMLPTNNTLDLPTESKRGSLPDGLHNTQWDTKSHEEKYLPAIRELISKDLSEPYSLYVYRYFLYQWGDLCFMALDKSAALIGVVICKIEPHRDGPLRGYIAMLAVREEHRGHGIAKELVKLAIEKMIERDADEIALETEVSNMPSLRLYESLGFLRCKRLHRYYLNGNAAFRLMLYVSRAMDADTQASGSGGEEVDAAPAGSPAQAALQNGTQTAPDSSLQLLAEATRTAKKLGKWPTR